MVKTYYFSDPLSMTDLAIDIQSRVYWGGYFYIDNNDINKDNEHINWKEFWNTVANEIDTKEAIGVVIDDRDNEVKFVYVGGNN